jgi:hypothetical protein
MVLRSAMSILRIEQEKLIDNVASAHQSLYSTPRMLREIRCRFRTQKCSENQWNIRGWVPYFKKPAQLHFQLYDGEVSTTNCLIMKRN